MLWENTLIFPPEVPISEAAKTTIKRYYHRYLYMMIRLNFPGFEAIGAVFPNIDVAILPLGAYEPAWFMGPQHMRPTESVRAYEMLRAGHFLGMHWGTYDLSDEPLDGGVYEGRSAFHANGHAPDRFITLQPGGTLSLEDSSVTADRLYEGSGYEQMGSSTPHR